MTKIVSLNGSISQRHHTESLNMELQFTPNKGKTINGNYGGGIWWLPVEKESGLKIFSAAKMVSLGEAQKYLDKVLEKYKALEKKLNVARGLIPEVRGGTILQFYGKSVNGGRKFYFADNDGDYYPALVMENCPMLTSVKASELAKLKMAFEADGIFLHMDTFRRQQLGRRKSGQIVVLDVTTQDGIKWL